MGVSKVIVNGVTKVDLTSDTVSSEKMLTNATAHDKAGNEVSGTIGTGSASIPNTTIYCNPNVTFDSLHGVVTAVNSKTKEIAPSVTPGYVASGTSGNITIDGNSIYNLPYKRGEVTYVPSTTPQVIPAETYLTGPQRILGDPNLVPENIAKNVTIFGVAGTHEGYRSSGDNVIFIDYDGTVVNSYSSEEFLTLNTLPDNPTHEGLIAQGWNWSLSDAKNYISVHNKLIIGQMYVTDDGATRLYVTITELNKLSFRIALAIAGSVSVDWGDGTSTTMSGTRLVDEIISDDHTYSALGNYVITINVLSGSFTFLNKQYDSDEIGAIFRPSSLVSSHSYAAESAIYPSTPTVLRKVEIGTGITTISRRGFYSCSFLESVTIPNTITKIEEQSFANCNSLNALVIPTMVDVIRMWLFGSDANLRIVSIPNNVTEIEDQVFRECRSLTFATFPDTVNYISEAVFMDCSSLRFFEYPNNENIDIVEMSMFENCLSLRYVTLSEGITSISEEAFLNCENLFDIYIPNSVNSIAYSAFENCQSLSSMSFPSGITLISADVMCDCRNLVEVVIPNTVNTISVDAFNSCHRLTMLTIPSSVRTISMNAFYNCTGMQEIHFKSSTPPTVGNSAFYNLSYYCKIYVPIGSLSAYQIASNYPHGPFNVYIEE